MPADLYGISIVLTLKYLIFVNVTSSTINISLRARVISTIGALEKSPLCR